MSLVGDFWKEQREESRNKKKLRKQNKKMKLTGEQKAYKIFGVFFALFLVFGSLFYTCRNTGDVGDLSFTRIIGLDDEIVEILSREIDTNILLPTGRINSTDYFQMIDIMTGVGLDIFTDGSIDVEKLDGATMDTGFTLEGKNLGAFVNRYVSDENNYMIICDVEMYEHDGDIMCSSVASFNIAGLFDDNTLPIIYVRNVSEFAILDGTISSLASTGRINLLDESDNEKVINVLNRNLIYDFNTCVNSLISSSVSNFVQLLGCNMQLLDTGIRFEKSI